MERHLQAKDGKSLPVFISAKPLDTPKGKLVIFTFTDITLLKQAERQYQSFFENAVEGIFQSTPDGRFLKVNPALAEILGFASPGELVDYSHLLGTGRREMDSTVRTVLLTTVPRFLKAAKSWQPTR